MHASDTPILQETGPQQHICSKMHLQQHCQKKKTNTKPLYIYLSDSLAPVLSEMPQIYPAKLQT